MSETHEQEQGPGPTKPVAQHEWLQNLVGEWVTETEMWMGSDEPSVKGTGRESVESLGGLWAFAKGEGVMPNGDTMRYFVTLGYDVSFHEYRGAWFADVSSHLWKYVGTLSDDGKTMTLDCTGPHMMKDGETANYRDVIELIDANTRRMISYGQDDEGNWRQFMVTNYRRA